jgi:hypothetical protein
VKPSEGTSEFTQLRSGSTKTELCYCAVGTVVYPEPGAVPGYLLYIKPTLCGASLSTFIATPQ